MKGNGNHVPTHSHTLDANLLSARHSQGEAIEKPWAFCRDLMAYKSVGFVNIISILIVELFV